MKPVIDRRDARIADEAPERMRKSLETSTSY
jgi:hypothetical protein